MSPKTAFIGLTASLALAVTVLFAQAPAGREGLPGLGQRQERGQQVEHDVQHDIFLVRRYKPLQQLPKTFHGRKDNVFLVNS